MNDPVVSMRWSPPGQGTNIRTLEAVGLPLMFSQVAWNLFFSHVGMSFFFFLLFQIDVLRTSPFLHIAEVSRLVSPRCQPRPHRALALSFTLETGSVWPPHRTSFRWDFFFCFWLITHHGTHIVFHGDALLFLVAAISQNYKAMDSENFMLKLKIHHLEEELQKMRGKSGRPGDEASTAIDLRVELTATKNELTKDRGELS